MEYEQGPGEGVYSTLSGSLVESQLNWNALHPPPPWLQLYNMQGHEEIDHMLEGLVSPATHPCYSDKAPKVYLSMWIID